MMIKRAFFILSDDQYKDMGLDWSDPAAVAEALVPGSGTVTTKENTSSVFSGVSADIIDDYCNNYDEKVVEFINEIGETITRPTGANLIEAIAKTAKGGPYYIVEDGITKECYDVVIFMHVSRISAYTATKEENVLSKETTPQAVFTATGNNSGTLSGVDTTMKYSTDGGASWTDITGATVKITGVTADKDIQVVKKGNGTTTTDSDAQIIDVTQAATPAGIGKTDCTTAAQNDGTITNVDSTMEYKLSTASEWTSIIGNTVTGLENGTYDVRVKANGTVLASAAATVTIGAHTCAAQGDWLHDANEHWKLCACGAEVDRAAHTGGSGWHSDENSHWNTCECGVKLNEAAHTFAWVIDKEATTAEAGFKHEECTVCGYAKAAVEIPATGDNLPSPQTGDNSNITLWITLLFVSGIGLFGATAYSRKKKYGK